ncbi:VOC family protein [Sedimentibacter hydroxybenzoicus DSM 7310]|uniref:VOC family protein n=1 Tax=Sedimentibacter hydroxybenzoicus DSM 7310 TaxID=1123245 RepID=A0A974BJP4_SEDHY|nr:VOC family protein [Sedimentibacter hydroxybenzoicus]NYB74520.1 VOC family protein [Sedimentibacter hydroxybenzoicus DSM 7310]
MGIMKLSSQITFLYFEKLDEARTFFEDVLELEKVFDPKWACVWRIGKDSFIGGVDVKEGSIEVTNRGGVLISFTVENIEEVYEKLKKYDLKDMTEIKFFEDISLNSFLFTGPEGYKFEVQQFETEELRRLF